MINRLMVGALAVLLVGVLAAPVTALFDNETVISFQDLNIMEHNDLEIYGLNTTSGVWDLKGVYNTTSPGVTFSPGSYQIIVKGSAISRLANPATMLEDGFAFLETYWLQIFIALGIIVFAIRKW
jgi:hypothetical protein